jgi:RHS repeat-associated protein
VQPARAQISPRMRWRNRRRVRRRTSGRSHYNGLRDFDPATGRYIESDPSGLNGGVNTYGYAFSSPLYRSDPLGLAPEREDFPPEATDPAEADPLAAIEYQILLSKIREYERDFEDPSWRAPNSPPSRSMQLIRWGWRLLGELPRFLEYRQFQLGHPVRSGLTMRRWGLRTC